VTGKCSGGNWVRVTITSTFTAVTPLAGLLGVPILSSSASAKIE
jgi:hypothetical protein